MADAERGKGLTKPALCGYNDEDMAKAVKITIIPRGMGALGYTMQLPEDDTFLSSEKKLLGDVDVMLGGRAAEQIIFNEISTGAANDIQRAIDTVEGQGLNGYLIAMDALKNHLINNEG